MIGGDVNFKFEIHSSNPLLYWFSLLSSNFNSPIILKEEYGHDQLQSGGVYRRAHLLMSEFLMESN